VSSNPLTDLDTDERARLEALLVEFDQHWSPDCLDLAVRQLPASGRFRMAALREMVKIDLERQGRRGHPIRLQQYLNRFPELAELDVTPSDLVEQGDASTPPLHAPTPAPVRLPEQFGRYRIIRQLGRGGMGSVFLAHDTELDRRVALKVPHIRADDAGAAERFSREARAAATIDHPNVCRIYDVGRIDDTPYLTMAYVDGPTLADELRAGPLPPRQAVEIVRDAAMALAAAHRQGVIHRDLKPGNILLQREEGGQRPDQGSAAQHSYPVLLHSTVRPIITDFGLARRETEEMRLTTVGEVLGTPLYMPPEQMTGDTDHIGPASDVYSLGAVLYEALTGRPPFAGSRSDVFEQALTRMPTPPSSVHPQVDPRLDAIVLRALAKRPADRFRGMSEFARSLDQWLHDRSRPTAKSARVWFGVGMAAALAAAVLVWSGVKFGWMSGTRGTGTQPSVKPAAEGAAPRLIGTQMLGDSDRRLVSAGFADDGQKVITAAADAAYVHFRKWDAVSGMDEPFPIERLLNNWAVFSVDGRRLLAGGGGHNSSLRQLETGATVKQFQTGPHALAGAIARDGRRLIVGGQTVAGDPFVRVYDTRTGDVVGSLGEHKKKVHAVAISDDGAWAYSASEDRHYLWDVNTNKSKLDGGSNTIGCALFVPKTHWCAVGNANGEITISDVSGPSLQILYFREGHKDAVTCLAATPDGKLLLSGSADRTLRAWDPVDGQPKWTISLAGSPTSLAVSPDSRRLVLTIGQTWQVWQLPSAK
jgi:WD40 repeat protein/tRNA A-37 threonylcarbamoyl transferase component Bud32